MKCNSENIYKSCRKMAGFDTVTACEKLGVGLRSLSEYENDTRVPPEKVVLKMADVYQAPQLPLVHLTTSTNLGRKYIPPVEILDLREAYLRYQIARDNAQHMDALIRNIVLDNQIGPDEVGALNNFMNTLASLNALSLSFYYSIKAKQAYRP